MKLKLIAISFFVILLTSKAFAQLPYSESFETDFGIWTQLTTDHFDWTRNSGFTPSNGTGPSTSTDGAYYIYIEANGHNDPPQTAAIQADFDFSGSTMPIISFDYHMYGQGIGNLFLYAYDGSSWTQIWNAFNDHGDQWNNTKICLGDYSDNANVKLKFIAETQYSDSSDIAIDNIQITDFRYSNISSSDVTCGQYFDGEITIDLIGGFAPYNYSIDDGFSTTADPATSHTFSGLGGADYVIAVIDDAGCRIDGGIVTLDEPDVPEIFATTQKVFPCPDSHNGEIEITATGLYSPFTYSINGTGGPFQISNTFTGLDTGTYQIAVKNSNGCIASGTDVVILPTTQIQILQVTKEDVSTCFGDCNGSLTILAAGGNAPLQYSINEGTTFSGNNYVNGLCAGNYRFVVEDSYGCQETSEYYEISQPDVLEITNVASTNVDGCFGDENGTITITAQGGTGDIIYSIDDAFNYQAENEFDNLPAGTYHVWVRDNKNCLDDGGEVIITQPDLLVLDSVTHQNIVGCVGGDDGEIHFYAHGGTPLLKYSIDDGNTFTYSSDFTNLSAGTYYPYLEDANGCSASDVAISITQPMAIEITNVNVYHVTDCYGAASGVIQIFAQYGDTPYQYSIDGGSTYSSTYSFTGLTAGDYSVSVKDANGCEVFGDTYTITQPTQITITEETSTDATCYNYNDGSIFVNATGGSGTLKYSINSGASYPYYVGNNVYLPAGTYNIAVKDNNGCSVSGSTLTINHPDSLAIDSVDVTNIEGCYGDETGRIIIYSQGGTEPINFSIDNGISTQLSNIFDNLPANTNYIPYIVDDNGCAVYGNPQTIGQPTPVVVANQSHTNIDTCYGVPVGTLTIEAHGGTGNIEYSIDNGNTFFDNGGFFDNLYAGNYNIVVRDEKGCLKNGWQETIFQPDSMIIDSITHNDVVCNGQSNGSISITAHGGQPQLRYSINGGTTFSYSYNFNVLPSGTYDIVIKDAYECYVNSEVTLNEPDVLILDTVTYTDVNTCFADTTGTITITAHGGVPDLLYGYSAISGSPTSFTTNNHFNNISAGAYYVTVKDQNGCYVNSGSFTITEPDPVNFIGYEVSDISCFGLSDGQISIQVDGGVGNFSYSIDNGASWQTDSIFYDLFEGSYIINAKDSNGCEIPYPYTVDVDEPQQLGFFNIETNNPSCFNYEDGTIIANPSGGTSPVNIILNDILSQTGNTFNDLSEGEYWITLVDVNGCVAHSDTFNLVMPPNHALFSMSIDEGCSPLKVTFDKEEDGPVFIWDFDDGYVSYNQNPTHIFFNRSDSIRYFNVIAHSEINNCIDTAIQTITVYNQPVLNFELDTAIHYYPDTIVEITNLNTSYFNYNWNFDDGSTSNITDPQQHSYNDCGLYNITLTAETDLQCVDTLIKPLLMTAVFPNSNFLVTTSEGCAPLNVNLYNASANAFEFEWRLNNDPISNDTNHFISFDEEGYYKVSLKAIGYCNYFDIDTAYIKVHGTPFADFDIPYDTVGVGSQVGFVNHTLDGYRYFWDFGDSTSSPEVNPFHEYSAPGSYDVTLKAYSRKGCLDTLTIRNAVYVTDEFYFMFPNAFSPDGDGIFDYLQPSYNLVSTCRIEIYTRRGQPVYITDDYQNMHWDGTRNGKPLPIDTYVWRAFGQYQSGKYFEEVGEVTIIR